MADLRKRFGQLVAAHRRRRGLTQEALAEAAGLSPEMVAKIETGRSGARFPVIERLAVALEADPAEFFTTQLPTGALQQGAFRNLTQRLVGLPEHDLLWLHRVVEAVLSARTPAAGSSSSTPSLVRAAQKSRGGRTSK